MPIDDYLEKLEISPKVKVYDNMEEFILIPSNDLRPEMLVSTKITTEKYTWNNCHNFLGERNYFMLTPSLFKRVINFIKDENFYDVHGNRFCHLKNRKIWNEFVGLHGSRREEWLNMYFKESSIVAWVLGSKISIGTVAYCRSNDPIDPLLCKLGDLILSKDQDGLFNLKKYLEDNSEFGLPLANNVIGNHHFFKPIYDSVVQFRSGKVPDAGFVCNANPLNYAGVRKAKWR